MTVLNFFVVRLVTEGGKRKAIMYLRYKFASEGEVEDLTASEASLTSFCFPLGPESVVAKEYMASEEYTFTLTGGDGRRYQGFCRKFLPPKPAVGSKLQLPQVMCLVSEDPWCAFYFRVLQVLEQLVKSGDQLSSDTAQLPSCSHAASFLNDLGHILSHNPKPSDIVKVRLPNAVDLTGVSPHRLLNSTPTFTGEQLELQVPLDCGNGRWNCGVSLARLLWSVPAPSLVTLIASMLLERRIVLVSTQRDTVTAAVQAASAMLYPFKWHHIYLPMLPQAFKDYLSAPMPFMVGMPGQMLGVLAQIPMDDTIIIDLDLGTCKPAPGSAADDARMLPLKEHLEVALAAAHRNIRSPTEHETSPLIASIMQEFYLRLMGNYRRFIHEDTPAANARWAAQVSSQLTGGAGSGSNSPRLRRDSAISRLGTTPEPSNHRGAAAAAGEHTMKAAGYVFEHTAFVQSHKRNDKVRTFLNSFRGSQMYAMFIQERLEMAAAGKLHDSDDPFEQRVNQYQLRRHARYERYKTNRGLPTTVTKWYKNLTKHRHTDSEEQAMMSAKEGLHSSSSASNLKWLGTTPPATPALPSSSQGGSLDPVALFPEDDDFDDLIEQDRLAAKTGDSRPASGILRMHTDLGPGPGLTPREAAAQASQSSASFSTAPRRSSSGNGAAHEGAGVRPAGLFSTQSETRQGVSVTVSQDGHKVYEGSIGSIMKGAFSELTSALGRRTSGTVLAGGPGSSSSSVTHVHGEHVSSRLGYRPQLSGEPEQPSKGSGLLSKYMPHLTSNSLSMSNLVDMANGKLKQPPPPSRPLLVSAGLGSSSSEMGMSGLRPSGSSAGAGLIRGSTQPGHGAEEPAGSGPPPVTSAPPSSRGPPPLLSVDDFDGFAALASQHASSAGGAVNTNSVVQQGTHHLSLLDV